MICKNSFNTKIEEGMKLKSLEIAKKLLSKGIEISFISEITGLSKEEIKSLN